VKHLVTGKIDGARGEEIVIDSGFNNLIYLDSQGKIKWKRKRRRVVPGPPPAIADINNDGQNEIILGTEALYVFDASGYELWSFQAPGSRHHVLCIATGNVDGYDGSEIIMSCPPGLWVLDGEGEVLWNYLRPLSEEQRAADPRRREYEYLDIISIVAVDIDKDGKDEVIAVSADKLYCFDDNGNLLWEVEPPRRSGKTMGIYIETKRRLVSCADLNDDGNLEIISAVGGLCIYSTAGEELWGVASSGEINDIAVCDINGDGQKEILVASDELEIFSNDGERIFNCEAGVGCLESVSVGDVDGDGIPEIVVGGCGVYVLKPTTN
jgi:outer membrane protein assembly factor BamB